jgi:DNA-binding Lrp family transcriptional regulator
MSAWAVPESRIEEVGRLISTFPDITHCYERPAQADWGYNLYAMIHGRSEGHCEEIARSISDLTGIHEYVLLFSSVENKKSSMEYF